MTKALEDVYREWIETVASVVTCRSAASSALGPPTSRFGMKFSSICPLIGSWAEFFQGICRLMIRSEYQQWSFAFDSGQDVVPSYRTEKKDQTLVRRLSVALRSVICLVRLLGTEGQSFEIIWDNNPASRPNSTAPETPPKREQWVSLEVLSVTSSLGVLHLRVKRKSGEKTIPETPPTIAIPPLNLDETYIQTHSLGGIEMVIETTTTGMTRINSSGSVAAVSARSFPAYSYQSSSEFICPRKYSDEGVMFGGSGGASSEYSWEATEEDARETTVVRIASLPFTQADPTPPLCRFIEQPNSVVTIVNEIERIRAQLTEYRIP